MWKYKMQSGISIVGLAVGFTCFALATLWIRYEMTYDSFHKDAKRMYVVYRQDPFSTDQTGYSRSAYYPLAAYLKQTFPEIEDATPLIPSYPGTKIIVEGAEFPAQVIYADSTFLRMFDVKIIEGNRDFLIPGSKKLAITKEKALQLFGKEDPIGKTVNNGYEDCIICAVVSEMPKQSNYAFDFISPFSDYILDFKNSWHASSGENTIIKLVPGTNVKAFEKKLYGLNTGEERSNISKMTIKPLTKIRYLDSAVIREVKFQHILIFSISGLLVILCSLFNYFTLFVSRFRIRQKELALRMVCGASGSSLYVMLTVEFILTLLLAILLGGLLTHWLHKPFLALADIQMNLLAVYRESLLYIGSIILFSLLLFWLILFIFRRRSLNLSIRQSNKNLSRKVSIIVQLIISMGFVLCTIVILKQIYFLNHTDELGFSFQNRGTVTVFQNADSHTLANRLKQIPEITEVVEAVTTLVPPGGRMSYKIKIWDNKPADSEDIDMEAMYVSPEFNAFYDFKLVAGEMLAKNDPDSLVLLNESAVKAFGWNDPVGKHFIGFKVKGVIKNVYNFGPTVPVKPVSYSIRSKNLNDRPFGGSIVLFKYREGMWKSCEEKVRQMVKKEYAGSYNGITNTEDEYNKFLKSENALIKLLSFVSAICVLICVFGFVSIVSLTCEERRKAIAIRKINGATVGDILSIFAKEYFLLLIIGAAIAFPAGYFVMQRWLEQYMKQTSISAWIYFSILFAMALLIILFVGWRVYKTSNENPAEVVKTE